MVLATQPINPRALEKALIVLGGDQLLQAVLVAYKALNDFETQGYNEGHFAGFEAGFDRGVECASPVTADDEESLRTAAIALDASIANDPPQWEFLPADEDYAKVELHQGDSGDEDK